MKRLIFYALLAAPFLTLGQETTRKPLPRFMYITPDMSKHQLDSMVKALNPYELYLDFDSLVYDNKRIKAVTGSLETKSEYFPLSSANFKGITIISKNDTTTVIMGLYYPQPKKK